MLMHTPMWTLTQSMIMRETADSGSTPANVLAFECTLMIWGAISNNMWAAMAVTGKLQRKVNMRALLDGCLELTASNVHRSECDSKLSSLQHCYLHVWESRLR